MTTLLDLTLQEFDLSAMPADERLQLATAVKEQLNTLYASIGKLAATFDRRGRGSVASALVTSAQNVNAYAEWFIEFGPEGFEKELPLNPALLRAVLKTDNPQHWKEQVLLRGLTAAQVRDEAGVKQDRKPPLSSGNGTARINARGNQIVIFPDSEPEDTRERECRVTYRVQEKSR